jgi:hypothetical protein
VPDSFVDRLLLRPKQKVSRTHRLARFGVIDEWH